MLIIALSQLSSRPRSASRPGAKLPASLALAALLALSACPGPCQALECGGGIDMPSQPEIAASHVRALSASLDGIAGTDAFDAAEECAEFIRQLYQLRLGSFPQSLSIAWSSLKDAASKQLAGAAREALDYACGFAASNAKASVDGVLSSPADEGWMLLLLNTDCDVSTGWEGFDFLVRQSMLWRWDAAQHDWEPLCPVAMELSGSNGVRFLLPRKALGLTSRAFAFDFKWADNPTALDNIITVSTTGDTAPNRRFRYRFEWSR